MKKVLNIAIDEKTKQFIVSEWFGKLTIEEMMSVLGFLSVITHNYMHILAIKQNDKNKLN